MEKITWLLVKCDEYCSFQDFWLFSGKYCPKVCWFVDCCNCDGSPRNDGVIDWDGDGASGGGGNPLYIDVGEADAFNW